MGKSGKILLVLGIASCLLFRASSGFAYYPPDPTIPGFYLGDADGDEYMTVLDIPAHETQAMAGLSLDYNTMQPNNDDQRWNTCDVDGDGQCTVLDLPYLYTVANGGTIDQSPFNAWQISNYNLPISGNSSGSWIPFQLGVKADAGAGYIGRPGMIVKVTIDPVGSTTTGKLSGRNCTPDFLGNSDQLNTDTPSNDQCATGVSITDWINMPAEGLTEDAGDTYGLKVYANGSGTLHLKAEVAEIASFLIPAFSNDFYISFNSPYSINIDCSLPGPNPVNELTAMQCNVTTTGGGTPQKDNANDTCGGSVSGSGPWTYNFTPTEAQGPGNCAAAVEVVEDTSVKDSGNVVINEVNVAPTDNAPTSSSWNEGTAVSFNINPTDPDIPVQTLTCSQVSNGCPAGSLTGCTWSGWTPTEAQGPTACDVVTRVYDGVAYSSQKTTHVIVNEVNQNPYWTVTPFDITVWLGETYNLPDGHAVDNDLPNAQMSDPGNITCDSANNTCSFPITVMGFGNNESKDCIVNFTAGSNPEVCSMDIKVTDGYNTTITQNIQIEVKTPYPTAISSGGNHTCALTPGGGVKCWGRNDYGQLGDNSAIPRYKPEGFVIGLSSGVTAISAGQYHSCALMSTGGVKCWGFNLYGQLGNNNTNIQQLTPVNVCANTTCSSSLTGVSAIAAGYTHTCALMSGGGVKCWGQNTYGQLGDNSTTNRKTPVNVCANSTCSSSLTGVTAIAAAGNHTCALMSSGGVKCWGDNGNGQLGDNSTTNRWTPVNVCANSTCSSSLTGVTAITEGYAHTCALISGGGEKCWGYNTYGQLGDNSTTDEWTPVNVCANATCSSSLTGVTAIAAGGYHTCALISGGGEKCWGQNTYGQLGDNSTTDRRTPVNVCADATCSSSLTGVTAVATGYSQTYALMSGGGLKSWGYNSYGAIGDNRGAYFHYLPADVSGLSSGVLMTAVGDSYTCTVMSGGEVKCWGRNDYGQLGDNSTTIRWTPVNVCADATCSSSLTEVTAKAAGGFHACALMSGGEVKCWGQNTYGQLGDNSTTTRYAPVNVCTDAICSLSLTGVMEIAAGYAHTCALMSGGEVKCWGYNTYGQLGDNSTTDRWTPVNVCSDATCSSSLAGVIAIEGGFYHTCAVMSDGGVKCWGYNNWGQLGDHSTTARWTPVNVCADATCASSLTGVTAIATGGLHTCAMMSTGGMKCWGRNDYGQLGDNSSTSRLTPVNVCSDATCLSSLNDVTAIGSSGGGNSYSTCAVSGGAAKCWGRNNNGQLGDGSITNRLTPVNVYGLSSGVSRIIAGYYHSSAVVSSGVKSWGVNDYGEIGTGYYNRLTPVDVLW